MEKRTFRYYLDVIVGLILIFISILIFYNFAIGLTKVVQKFIREYPEISVALITGFFAFISVPIGKFLENRYNSQLKIREEKRIVYLKFLDWLIDNMLNNRVLYNNNIVEEIRSKQKELTIFASDEVFKNWLLFVKQMTCAEFLALKENMSNEEKIRHHVIYEWPYLEKVILSIRKELGYKNKNIQKYDILELYISDIENYLN